MRVMRVNGLPMRFFGVNEACTKRVQSVYESCRQRDMHPIPRLESLVFTKTPSYIKIDSKQLPAARYLLDYLPDRKRNVKLRKIALNQRCVVN